jgi:NADH-quinone oxidoreductase subunit E
MENPSVESILASHERRPSELLAILQDIQNNENWLPREALVQVAAGLKVPLTRVYGMATFFSSFSLKPRGQHVCTVCMGTACHVRGASRLVEHVQREYGIAPGETTPDQRLTLETVNCVGACALGPLVILDDEYHGQLSTQMLGRLLKPLCRNNPNDPKPPAA